jgi:hypothetical protein
MKEQTSGEKHGKDDVLQATATSIGLSPTIKCIFERQMKLFHLYSNYVTGCTVTIFNNEVHLRERQMEVSGVLGGDRVR